MANGFELSTDFFPLRSTVAHLLFTLFDHAVHHFREKLTSLFYPPNPPVASTWPLLTPLLWYFLQDEEKAKLTHSRLLELCRGVATEHVLHKYNITDPSIVSLTSKPAKLICQLYETFGAREPGTAHHPPGTGTSPTVGIRASFRIPIFSLE